ncbi:MAG: sulfite exporter TauE/SafE family protein [Actinomycetota bacterium]
MSGAELIAVLLAVSAGALVKSVTGMGLPLVAIPVLAAFVGIEDAVVILSLPNLLANAYLVHRHRAGRSEAPPLGRFVVAGVVGTVVGVLLLSVLSETVLTVALAVAVFGYIGWRLRWPEAQMSGRLARRIAPGAGAVAGVFQGAIGVSGPIVVSYVHALRPPRAGHLFSVTGLFFVINATQFIGLIGTGLLTGDRFLGSLVASVPVMAATLGGSRLGDRLGRVAFDRAVLATLGGAGVVLVIELF